MIPNNIYLDPNEWRAVQMLAEEKSYAAIKRECHVLNGKCPTSAMPQFLARIRRKTGITDTRDARQAQDYVSNFVRAIQNPPTAEQLETLRRVLGIGATWHGFEDLGKRLEKTAQEAQAFYVESLRAIGITATLESEQRVQARAYFAALPSIVTPAEPISPKQWDALRLYAEGMSFAGIAKSLGLLKSEYAQGVIRGACDKLGVRAAGRGVQRRLVAIALASQGKEAVTMDDPSF